MSTKFPFMIQDQASGLCWTAANPSVPATTFSLQTCVHTFPPPANQRFVTVMKYWSGSADYSKPDNKPMTILDSSASASNPAIWDANSLCFSWQKNTVSTVKCGNNGTYTFDSKTLGGTCFGPDAVDSKTIVAYPCPSRPTLVQYKPWQF